MSKEATVAEYLYQHMPITKAMGIDVLHASPEKLILTAPLENNINHKGTAFGGSLHAATTLACWSLLWVNVRALCDDPIEIVVAQSNATYHLPVDRDFVVECHKPEAAIWDRFARAFTCKRKVPIKLSASISHDDQLCMSYEATFVTMRP